MQTFFRLLIFFVCSILWTNIKAQNYNMALVDVKSSGYEFHDGLALFRENKLFGYLANNGDVAISPRFILAEDFTDGQAIVETSTGIGIINTKGMFLLPPNYKAIDKAPEATNLYVIVDNDDNVGLYYDNRIIVQPSKGNERYGSTFTFPYIMGVNVLNGKRYNNIRINGNYFTQVNVTEKGLTETYFDKFGNIIYPKELVSSKGIELFSNPSNNFIYGFRDSKTKKVIVPPTYNGVFTKIWTNDRMILEKQGKLVLLNEYGKEISFEIAPKGFIPQFHKKFIAIYGDSYEIYDYSGKYITSTKNFNEVKDDDNNWISIEGSSKNYIYNLIRGTKVEGIYCSCSDNMIKMRNENDLFFYVDAKTGRKLDIIARYAADFSEGLAQITSIEGNSKIIDKNGNTVLTFNEDFRCTGKKFSEGVLGVYKTGAGFCYMYNPIRKSQIPYNQKYGNKYIQDKWFDLGMKYLNSKKYAEAKEYFYRVMMNDPQNSPAINNYGVCMERMGFKDEAIELYKIAVDIDPENETARKNIEILNQKDISVEDSNKNRSNTFWNALESFGNLLGQMSNTLSGGSSDYMPSNYSFGGDNLSEANGSTSTNYYQTQYAKWESIAERHYNSITNLGIKVRDSKGNRAGSTLQSMGGGRYVQMKQQFREAQRQMRNTRLNAKNKGITIAQSKWETATINY